MREGRDRFVGEFLCTYLLSSDEVNAFWERGTDVEWDCVSASAAGGPGIGNPSRLKIRGSAAAQGISIFRRNRTSALRVEVCGHRNGLPDRANISVWWCRQSKHGWMARVTFVVASSIGKGEGGGGIMVGSHNNLGECEYEYLRAGIWLLCLSIPWPRRSGGIFNADCLLLTMAKGGPAVHPPCLSTLPGFLVVVRVPVAFPTIVMATLSGLNE